MIAGQVSRLRTRAQSLVDHDGRREWFFLVGGVGLLVVCLLALLGPTLAPYPVDDRVGQPLEPPGEHHLLGTDDVGHDLLSLLLVGARVSLLVGLLSGSIAILVGVLVGVAAGVVGGRVERLLMRTVDVVLTLPFLPLVIVAAAVLGPSLWTTIGVLASVMWARPARELRSQVLSVREREYVRASRSMGASLVHLAREYAVPALAPIVVAQFAKAVGAAILLEASLSFLGLGDPTAPSWGTILFFAQNRSAFLTNAWPWWVLPPGLAITGSVLSFTFLALGAERRRGSRRRGAGAPVDSETVEIVPASAADEDTVLAVSDLTVAYGSDPETVAVQDLDLAVHEDEVLGVVGESGSGKTSLALALVGLLREPARVTGGTITLRADGCVADAVAIEDVRGDEIAYVPQEAMNALDPRRRLHDQVVEAIETHRSPGSARAAREAHEVLETVGLERESHDRYPHELSGGMRQRGVVAIALVNDPSVLVVDEPTTGLDVVTTMDVLDLLAEIQAERGLSTVLVSHDLPAVTRLADRLAVVQNGGIVEVGATDALRTSPGHPYTESLLSTRSSLPTGDRSTGGSTTEGRRDPGRVPALAYEGISKSFGGEPVLTDVDLALEPGEAVALVGKSGAGKSTLGRLATGMADPDGGTVLVGGDRVSALLSGGPRQLGRRVHYVFQDPYASLPPNRPVEWIVREPLDVHEIGTPADRRRRVREVLTAVGLGSIADVESRYPATLSGGERQRVALARAFVLEPSVIVADEPTSMLDAPLQDEILTLLYELVADRETTLLHVTHDVAGASAFADRIAVLHDGRVVETGPPASILADPEHEQTRRLVAAALSLSAGEPADRPHAHHD